jgi:hypothetical protein
MGHMLLEDAAQGQLRSPRSDRRKMLRRNDGGQAGVGIGSNSAAEQLAQRAFLGFGFSSESRPGLLVPALDIVEFTQAVL